MCAKYYNFLFFEPYFFIICKKVIFIFVKIWYWSAKCRAPESLKKDIEMKNQKKRKNCELPLHFKQMWRRKSPISNKYDDNLIKFISKYPL